MKYPKVNGKRCTLCHGYGRVREARRTITGNSTHVAVCPRCNGSKVEPAHNGHGV